MNSFEIIAYPLLPIAAMELLLGFLLLSQNLRSSPVHRSVVAMAFFSAAYSLNTAIMYLTASRGYDYILFARMNWIGWFAIPAGLQFLFYLRSETAPKARMVGYVFYPLWTIILTICLFSDLIVTPRYLLIPYVNHPGPLEIPARMGGALMLLWMIVEIVRIRRQLTGIKKFQLDHFFYGVMIFAFAAVMMAGIMPAIGSFAVEPGLSSYFSLPWVVLTFYAIVRYSLFEMRIIFSRTLGILLLILVCSAVQAAILSSIEPALDPLLANVISLSLLGFFLFGTPVSRKIQSFVNSLIVGSRYNYEVLMREAIVTLNAKREEHELIDYLIETTCAGLNVGDAGFYLHRIEDGFVMRQGRGIFAGMRGQRSLADIAVNKLQDTNRSLILAEMVVEGEDAETSRLAAYMQGIGAEVIVPLLFQGRLQGVLVLGAKVNNEMFGQSDVGFLETLAAHAASALENARLNEITGTIRSSLKESEERFTSLAQRMPTAVFIHQGSSIVYANSAAEVMTGYSREQLLTMHINAIIHPEYLQVEQPHDLERIESQMHGGEKEVQVFQRGGRQRWAVMTSAVIEYGGRAAAIWILFDITEHKRTESNLRYERVRDAIGRMAAYLSRDLEGMVKAIRRVTEFQDHSGEDQHQSDCARKILSTVEQMEVLIRTMKDFSVRQETKRILQDLNDLIGKRQQILTALLTGNSALVVRSSPEPLKVFADPIKIENMLMSLVVNAKDQMPQGGVVTVATGSAVIDADFIQRMGYGRAGVYATVSVSDTGEGMDAVEQERIFEPFFTTRADDKGNGLVLSMVYDIVKEHEGYVSVASRTGQGSTYMVYLPLVL